MEKSLKSINVKTQTVNILQTQNAKTEFGFANIKPASDSIFNQVKTFKLDLLVKASL